MVLSTSPDSSVTSGCRQILSASDATMMTIASLPGQKILFTFLFVVQYKWANDPFTKIVCSNFFYIFFKTLFKHEILFSLSMPGTTSAESYG